MSHAIECGICGDIFDESLTDNCPRCYPPKSDPIIDARIAGLREAMEIAIKLPGTIENTQQAIIWRIEARIAELEGKVAK